MYSHHLKRKERKMELRLTKAEEMAANGNINGVAAFIKNHGSEYDRVTIQVLKETLMQAYINANGDNVDSHVFANIKRIANL